MPDGFDQNEIIEFLANPSTHGGKAVECSDTHSAIIFLAGNRAYKHWQNFSDILCDRQCSAYLLVLLVAIFVCVVGRVISGQLGK